ncbi:MULTISPECIES: YigZ family protein [unclassified Gemella]|uniref:YigZ family protein n=1 Tax=unclassified Gemella TaxID=2624949 RepID=UPI0015D0A821|nr:MULTISPECIES: YigZ family protein [unclassified Gemella]MBF0710052.1 YigZ family protein [Gemella sp. GL1.1]NYS27396.1 YigZ family protein [Gemella sp. GL1]
MEKQFITIKNNISTSFIEKKSKFITHLIRITDEDDAKNFIKNMKKEHYNASHVCFAFALGDNNEICRINDDGEPSGTAGAPMLDCIIKNNLRNVCAVVIRYYGGIKLGTGGLVRAYTHGLIEAIKNASLVERKNAIEIKFEIDYHLNGKIEYEIAKTPYIVNNISYTDKIAYDVYVMKENEENFLQWIQEITSDNFKIIDRKEKKLEFDIN